MSRLDVLDLDTTPNLFNRLRKPSVSFAIASCVLAASCATAPAKGGDYKEAEPVPAESVEPAEKKPNKPTAKKAIPDPKKNVTIRGAYRRGSTGPMVRKIEQALDDIGCKVGSKRNYLDNIDIKSIKIFQGNYRFDPADGVPGPDTRDALFAGAEGGNKNCAEPTPYKPDPLIEQCKNPAAKLLLAGLCD